MESEAKKADQGGLKMQNKVDVKGFIQVCIVVEDIEKSLDYWMAMFNIKPHR